MESPLGDDEKTILAVESPLVNVDESPLPVADREEFPFNIEEESPLVNEDESPLADEEESPLGDEGEPTLVDEDESSLVNEDELPLADEEAPPLADEGESTLVGEGGFRFPNDKESTLEDGGESPLPDEKEFPLDDEESFLDDEGESPLDDEAGSLLTNDEVFSLDAEEKFLLTNEEVLSLESSTFFTHRGFVDVFDDVRCFKSFGSIFDFPILLSFFSPPTIDFETDADEDFVPLFSFPVTVVSSFFFLSTSSSFGGWRLLPAVSLLVQTSFVSSDRVSFRGLLLFLALFPPGLSEGLVFCCDFSLKSLLFASCDVLLSWSCLLPRELDLPSFSLEVRKLAPTKLFISCRPL